jgi:hypothetical protein
MSRFTIHDIQALETTAASPGTLRTKIGDMIVNSVLPGEGRGREPQTGEYRPRPSTGTRARTTSSAY